MVRATRAGRRWGPCSSGQCSHHSSASPALSPQLCADKVATCSMGDVPCPESAGECSPALPLLAFPLSQQLLVPLWAPHQVPGEKRREWEAAATAIMGEAMHWQPHRDSRERWAWDCTDVLHGYGASWPCFSHCTLLAVCGTLL